MCQSPEVTAPSLGKSQWLTLVAGVQLLPSRLSPALPETQHLTPGKGQLKQHLAVCAKHCPGLPWDFMLPGSVPILWAWKSSQAKAETWSWADILPGASWISAQVGQPVQKQLTMESQIPGPTTLGFEFSCLSQASDC